MCEPLHTPMPIITTSVCIVSGVLGVVLHQARGVTEAANEVKHPLLEDYWGN